MINMIIKIVFFTFFSLTLFLWKLFSEFFYLISNRMPHSWTEFLPLRLFFWIDTPYPRNILSWIIFFNDTQLKVTLHVVSDLNILADNVSELISNSLSDSIIMSSQDFAQPAKCIRIFFFKRFANSHSLDHVPHMRFSCLNGWKGLSINNIFSHSICSKIKEYVKEVY